jgi:hypothetical protein
MDDRLSYPLLHPAAIATTTPLVLMEKEVSAVGPQVVKALESWVMFGIVEKNYSLLVKRTRVKEKVRSLHREDRPQCHDGSGECKFCKWDHRRHWADIGKFNYTSCLSRGNYSPYCMCAWVGHIVQSISIVHSQSKWTLLFGLAASCISGLLSHLNYMYDTRASSINICLLVIVGTCVLLLHKRNAATKTTEPGCMNYRRLRDATNSNEKV